MYQLKKTPEELRNQIDDIVVTNLQLKDTFDKIITIFSELEYQIQSGLSLRESITDPKKIELIDSKISKLRAKKIEIQENIDSLTLVMNKGKQMLKAAQAMLSELNNI
tara:strand:+ start:6108 stop:6431 length:324 start_codon:yes stop_codon:yes gene_type:complete